MLAHSAPRVVPVSFLYVLLICMSTYLFLLHTQVPPTSPTSIRPYEPIEGNNFQDDVFTQKFRIKTPKPYNDTKLALLIESQPQPYLTPMLLHFMSVVPPDWPFLFLGSNKSITHLTRSAPIRTYMKIGKLDMRLIPEDMPMTNQEEVSKVFTNPEFYKLFLPAEWLFVFQLDSMICANSRVSLDDWVEKGYTWVGAPWNAKGGLGGGNGGFSLRRMSYLIRLLESQSRFDGEQLEDQWLFNHLARMPGAKLPPFEVSREFSVERIPFGTPLGYHTGGRGTVLPRSVWRLNRWRKRIFDYCPEMKMFMQMVVDGPQESDGCWKDDISGTGRY
ncbi:hypothetical protein DRE_02121 [Drechslerella stenobrocha 248]|uniref:DUF5672 domain-containing protein n=1 Tax=Drechslerella stenobrocha 248 TaxID=1043628 RepID=W7I8E5_9PEZI|nr:hypothetical protein DRE_02121 [Drechslerella stenobrocha 248]